jgi:hypothetical protein
MPTVVSLVREYGDVDVSGLVQCEGLDDDAHDPTSHRFEFCELIGRLNASHKWGLSEFQSTALAMAYVSLTDFLISTYNN